MFFIVKDEQFMYHNIFIFFGFQNNVLIFVTILHFFGNLVMDEN